MVLWMQLLVAWGDRATLGPMHKPHQDWHTLPVEPHQDWHMQQESHQDWHKLQMEPHQDWHMHLFPPFPAPQQDCHWAAGSVARQHAIALTSKAPLMKPVWGMLAKALQTAAQ